ncbi:MAG: helix-turn-helix domain-containing protein [Actinomycetota bacterium]
MEWDPAHVRALRHALRLSQESFAYQVGAAPKTVRNWEGGRHPPGLALQRALDDALESASAEQKKRFFASLAPDHDVGAMPGGAAPAGTAPAVSLDDLKRIAAALVDARCYMDREAAEHFRRQIAACAAADGLRGPKHTLPAVLGIVGAVERSACEVKLPIRAELLRVGAQCAEFAAWLYRDLGVSVVAECWRDRAIEWAEEAGDSAMQGYVLLKKSQAAWDERDAPRMLSLAQAVQQGSWRIPIRVRAEAVQQEARGHAMLGDGLQVMERKLDEARELLATEGSQDGLEDEAQLSSHYGPPLFAMQTAICYCEAGRPGRAVEIYRDQLIDEAFSRRDYGYFLSLMANALAAAGEPGEASGIGIKALSIALATNSTRTVREVSRVGARLEPWRHHPPVRELHDALTATGASVSSW